MAPMTLPFPMLASESSSFSEKLVLGGSASCTHTRPLVLQSWGCPGSAVLSALPWMTGTMDGGAVEGEIVRPGPRSGGASRLLFFRAPHSNGHRIVETATPSSEEPGAGRFPPGQGGSAGCSWLRKDAEPPAGPRPIWSSARPVLL